MTALTLADMASNPKPLVRGVVNALREASPLMDNIPFVNVGSLSIEVIRNIGLPDISWRKIGEDHGSSKGKIDKVTENAFSFGNYIDVDKAYVMDKNQLIDPRAKWAKDTMTAMAFKFNDAFINGSKVTDPDMMTGLFYRINNDLPSSQLINANLDISPDTSVTDPAARYFDVLDELISQLPGGQADLLLMNDTTKRRHDSLARKSGLLATTKDQLGRKFTTYGEGGPKIIDVGYSLTSGVPTSRIITNTETSYTSTTGGSTTSIYAVRLGEEYLTAWEEYPISTENIGLLEDGVTYRTIVDWMIGLALTHPQSVARAYALTAA